MGRSVKAFRKARKWIWENVYNENELFYGTGKMPFTNNSRHNISLIADSLRLSDFPLGSKRDRFAEIVFENKLIHNVWDLYILRLNEFITCDDAYVSSKFSNLEPSIVETEAGRLILLTMSTLRKTERASALTKKSFNLIDRYHPKWGSDKVSILRIGEI